MTDSKSVDSFVTTKSQRVTDAVTDGRTDRHLDNS